MAALFDPKARCSLVGEENFGIIQEGVEKWIWQRFRDLSIRGSNLGRAGVT